MSARDAAQAIRGLGAPPKRDEVKGNLASRPGRKRKAEKMAQLNLRVPEDVKYRVRILAARDRREMSDIIIEAIALYEELHGPVPKLEPRRS